MRLAFALTVIVAHAPVLLTGNPLREPLTQLLGGRLFAGGMAVDGFFLLSGYLIVRSWAHSRGIGSYLQSRFLRIVPGFVLAFMVSTVVAGACAPGVPHLFATMMHFKAIERWLVSLLLLDSPIMPPVFPGLARSDPNGSMWTIPYEMRCYLLVALVGSFGLLRKRWAWLVLTGAAFAGFLVIGTRLDPRFGFWCWGVLIGKPSVTFRLFSAFAIGGCFYLFREEIPLQRWAVVIAGILLPVALWCFPAPEMFLILLGGYLLFYVERHVSYPEWLRRLPDVSYGVYLYGWPVESLWLWHWRGSPLWVAILGSCLVSLVLGWLSWHFVERPMLALKRSRSATLPAG
jgi:peptidoglycan/LPS O-acetylase OafA/YrhL